MYKKLISILLAITIFICNSSLFAQNIDYKPAISFGYNYYTLGKTNEENFIKSLKQDMYENFKDVPLSPNGFYNKYSNKISSHGFTENVYLAAEAYNDFLYYNFYPQKSPYWKWTAFEADGEASEDDVLLILQKHRELSKEILKLLKQNPRYKMERESKITISSLAILLMIAEGYAFWEGPLFAGAATGATKAASIGAKVKKGGIFLTAMGVDIWATDYLAYHMRTLEGAKESMDDVDIWKAGIFDNIKDRNMLKSQIESKKIQICSEAEENLKNVLENNLEVLDKKGIDKWQPIVRFCNGNKRIIKDKQFRQNLGQYLISAYKHNIEYPEDAIQSAREEMVAIYHALLFVKAELLNKNDPLRYDRAFIDIVTAYKIARITITDGRLQSILKEAQELSQTDILFKKGLSEKDLTEKIIPITSKINKSLSESYETEYSTARSMPSLLPRAQVNYIAQKISIHNQKTDKANQEKMEKFWNDYAKQQKWQAFK